MYDKPAAAVTTAERERKFVVVLEEEEEALLLSVDKHCCFCRRTDKFIAFVVRSKLRVKNISFAVWIVGQR